MLHAVLEYLLILSGLITFFWVTENFTFRRKHPTKQTIDKQCFVYICFRAEAEWRRLW